ncbi:MAG: hypothetical protein ACLTV6_04180 [Christensenellales bacterium]
MTRWDMAEPTNSYFAARPPAMKWRLSAQTARVLEDAAAENRNVELTR